jgi:hypothetical protein
MSVLLVAYDHLNRWEQDWVEFAHPTHIIKEGEKICVLI